MYYRLLLLHQRFLFLKLGQLALVLLDTLLKHGHNAFRFQRLVTRHQLCGQTSERPHFDLLERSQLEKVTRLAHIYIAIGKTFWLRFKVFFGAHHKAFAAKLAQGDGDVLLAAE